MNIEKDLIIEFGYSSSPNYPLAVKMASECHTYSEMGTGKSKRHRLVWERNVADKILSVYDLAHKWKGFQVFYNGVPFHTFYNLIHSWFYCYQERKQTTDAMSYCFVYQDVYDGPTLVPFGCKKIEVGFGPHAEWLRFGSLRQDGSWIFDKPRMVHYVKHHWEKVRFCPAASPDWIDRFFDIFPDSINPQNDRDWHYQYKEAQRGAAIELKIVLEAEGSRPDEGLDEIIGVGPKDRESANYILKEIFRHIFLKYECVIPNVFKLIS